VNLLILQIKEKASQFSAPLYLFTTCCNFCTDTFSESTLNLSSTLETGTIAESLLGSLFRFVNSLSPLGVHFEIYKKPSRIPAALAAG
jgi:hypothetical protein